MATCGEACAALAQRLRAAGIDGAGLDARLLVAAAAGIEPDAVFFHPERRLDAQQLGRLETLAGRRLRREPISRLLGRREFWSLDFALGPDTLDPRPDSETLIEAALEVLTDRRAPWRVLDLGAGSGCLLLALLSELPAGEGLGVDISPGAVAMASANAAALGMAERARFAVGDWAKGLVNHYDIILCNPPYIPAAEIDRLEPEVAEYEPRRALTGGEDGLECYRALVPQLAGLLAPAGTVLMEVGAGQADRVCVLLGRAGLVVRARRQDLAGVERCLVATLPPSDAGRSD